jgi:hypothetical protein
MHAYQIEQREALGLVQDFLSGLTPVRLSMLRADLESYLRYRETIDRFLSINISQICRQTCYEDQRSACCSKDGIITFFADVLVNAVCSNKDQIDRLTRVLKTPHQGFKCLYLANQGCLWKIKPLNCALFLCDSAKNAVFHQSQTLALEWDRLTLESRQFKWPDRPVLFDRLEDIAMQAGFACSLMYFHNSPGLLSIKQRAGLISMHRSNN